MRVEVVENICEGEGAEGAIEGAVKLALQSLKSALQSDESLFENGQGGGLRLIKMGENPVICSGVFVLCLRDPEASHNRGLHLQLIQKLFELLKDAGSSEIFAAKLCLSAEAQREASQEILTLRMELESVGDSNEQAMLRWGLGLAHLQQALLFVSRNMRQQISRDKSQWRSGESPRVGRE